MSLFSQCGYHDGMWINIPVSLADVGRAEQHDPGRGEAWWWLWLPVLTAMALLAIAILDADFYRTWILPEAVGALEIAHVLVPLGGFLITLSMLRLPLVGSWRLMWWTLAFFAATCLYIGGEEMSWGQWYLHWETPEYWSRINRQNETNLHNTSYYFNHGPRNLLKAAIVVGGIVLPLVPMHLRGMFASLPYLRLMTPPVAVLPTAVIAMVLNLIAGIDKDSDLDVILPRPSEAAELFMYLFILFYLVILRRRLAAL